MISVRAPRDTTWVLEAEDLEFGVEVSGRAPLRRCALLCSDADPAREYADAGPEAVAGLTGDLFIVIPVDPGRRRQVIGARVTQGAGGQVEVPTRPGRGTLRGLLLGYRQVRPGRADELAR